MGLLIYGDLDTVSGGYLYDRKLVEHLMQCGDEVSVISLPWRNYTEHLGDNFKSSLLSQLEKLPVDILLQDELNHPSLFLLNRRLRARISYPIISIVHHLRCCEARSPWQNIFYRCIESRYLSSVDGFVFNSQTTRRVVEGLVGTNRPSVVSYPAADRLSPAVNEELITVRAKQNGRLRLAFLGNVIPRKGLHTLLEAMDRLPGNSWSLDVIGSLHMDKAYASTMRRRASRGCLAERVFFLDMVTDAVLCEKLMQSHLLVVPSFYEGFGIVYLEGMGFGLPAIGTTAGAAGEIITPGQDGYLIPPGDSTALAMHLHALDHDRQKLLTMSLNARWKYDSHSTWETAAGRIRSFLQGFLHGRRPASPADWNP